jgi:hypothetical protein
MMLKRKASACCKLLSMVSSILSQTESRDSISWMTFSCFVGKHYGNGITLQVETLTFHCPAVAFDVPSSQFMVTWFCKKYDKYFDEPFSLELNITIAWLTFHSGN